jgi:hypothetical protein
MMTIKKRQTGSLGVMVINSAYNSVRSELSKHFKDTLL